MALMAGCAGSATQSASTSGASNGKSFIYIAPEPLGGNPFIELGQTATNLAAQKFGGTAKTFESTDQTSLRSNMDAAVAAKPDVIVLITYDVDDLSKEYAEKYPDQQFILLDDCPSGMPTTTKNLHCGVFREYEPSYLLGYEAGLLTKTNKLGDVVAEDIPFLHRYSDSFYLGAKAANPNVTQTQLFVGGQNPYTDVAQAKQLALQLSASGVDSVFAVGDYGGSFEAAQEKGFDVYSTDYNQCSVAPGHVADGTLKRLDVVLETLAQETFAGTAPLSTSFGLKEDGMDIVSLAPGASSSGCRVMGFPDIVSKLKAVRQEIVDGKISIPDPAAAATPASS